MEPGKEKETSLPTIATNPIAIFSELASKFGLSSITMIVFAYVVLWVYYPNHEDFMRKQIEQCSQGLLQVSKDFQSLLFKIDQIQKTMDQKGINYENHR